MLRCDAGRARAATEGHDGPRRRARHALALAAGVAVALSAGAATATPALAFAEHTQCVGTVYNHTPNTLRVYNTDITGSTSSEYPLSIPPGAQGNFHADSWFPITNHCTVHLWWEMSGTWGAGWWQSMETYVYDPNSGRNNASASMTGYLGETSTVTSVVQDAGETEILSADVSLRPAPAALTADADPLSAASAAPERAREPKEVPSLLRRGDLIGRGWRRVTRMADLGRIGSMLSATKVPASCQDTNKSSEPSPLREGLSAFALRSGAGFAGAGQALYANPGQARRTIDDAVSSHSIGCLARLFTSPRFHTRVSIQRHSTTLLGRRVISSRLTIRTRSGARTTATDYLDVIGALHSNANVLLMFASHDRAPEHRGELATVSAVIRRLR